MTKIQIFGCVVGVLVVFFSGYRYAASIYEAEMAEMVADYERQARSSVEEINRILADEREKNAENTSKLLAQIDDLERRSRDSAVRVDRMRRELASRAKVPTPHPDSCGDCEKRLAGCSELLSEGIGLADEGRRLAERIAVRKDAAVSTAQQGERHGDMH
jgi:hypothetical protein